MKTKIIFLFIMMSLFIVPLTYAKDKSLWGFIDSVGIDYQFGTDSLLPQDYQGEHCANRVERLAIRAESRRLLFSDKWGLQGEIHYSAHKADEKPDYGQDTGFHEIGFNIFAKWYLPNDICYIGAGGGVSYIPKLPNFENREYWPESSQQSDIGQSHCFGSIGVLIGKDWKVYKAWAVRTEARFTHSSDPLQSDKGKEFLGLVAGITYYF